MIVLDTDHTTHLKYPESDRGRRLIDRLEALPPKTLVGVTIISVEERMRGWLAVIARERSVQRQVTGYRELGLLLDFYSAFEILQFDTVAAEKCEKLRSMGLRIGTMDLKIASIALTNNALLLTANRADFSRVPGLRFENWIE